MVDLTCELIPLADVPERLPPSPRTGRGVHRATVFRWIANGVRGVRLEVVRIGGSTYVEQEVLQRFVDRTTAADRVSTA